MMRTLSCLISMVLIPLLIVSAEGPVLAGATPIQAQTALQIGGTLEDVVNIDLRTDIRVFTVMAALVAAGFGTGQEERLEMTVVRKLRDDLSDLDVDLRGRLRVLFAARTLGSEEARHTAYTSLALLLTGPPDFRLREDGPEIPEDVRHILGFEELLGEFYLKAGIESLWSTYRPLYQAELEAYGPVVKEVIRSTLNYFRIPARVVLDRSIVIMPDLLGYRNVVHARNLEKIYYLVLGPAEAPKDNFVQLQHEYLHFLLDPLVEKHAGQVLKQRSLLALAESQPDIGRDFRGRFLLIVTESLIEAILHRLHPAESWERASVELFRRGLVFAPHFYQQLEQFQGQSEVAFPAYLESLVTSVDEDVIERDAEMVAEREAGFELKRTEAEAKEAEIKKSVQRNRLISDAGRLIAEQRWSEAEEQLTELLRLDPANGNALFYLGQIAAQQQDHERAFHYYQEADRAGESEPWVKAWCAVRIGRYLAHQGKFEEARLRFESVLESGEDFNGARGAAQESLGHLPPPGP